MFEEQGMKDKAKRENNESKKFSIEHCKKILNKNGRDYNDEQVRKIRDFLYFIAEMEYESFLEKQQL